MIEQPKIQRWKAWDKKYYNIRTFPPVEVEMNVPSGKIIIENDIRHYWPEVPDYFDVNETLGLKLTTEAYGRYGMFHGFVGNSCPGVYKNGDFFYIGKQGRDDDHDKVVDPLPGEYVGGVVTDLWWYCVADLDDYLARGGEIYDRHSDVVDVTPGRYVLKHYYAITQQDDNYNSNVKEEFATFELSDEPLNQYLMPEEPLYTEIPRILTEVDHFSHEYRGKTDELSLLMTIRGRGTYPRYKPKPNIQNYNWWWYFRSLGRLVRVKFPAQLANEGRYDEIAVSIKKQSWADIKKDLEHERRMRDLKRFNDSMTPEEKEVYRKKSAALVEKILKELKEERDR